MPPKGPQLIIHSLHRYTEVRYLNKRKEPEENRRIVAKDIGHHSLQCGANPPRHQLLVTAVTNPGETAGYQQQLFLMINSCCILTLCKFIQVCVQICGRKAAQATQCVAFFQLLLKAELWPRFFGRETRCGSNAVCGSAFSTLPCAFHDGCYRGDGTVLPLVHGGRHVLPSPRGGFKKIFVVPPL